MAMSISSSHGISFASSMAGPSPSQALEPCRKLELKLCAKRLVCRAEAAVEEKQVSPPVLDHQDIVPIRCRDSKPGQSSRRYVSAAAAAAGATAVGMAMKKKARAATAACELVSTPTGIEFCDVKLGDGPAAEKGQLIKAHYTGRLTDGTVFDTSYKRGRPLVFRVGVNEVIQGWDSGILGTKGIPPMLPGGKRTLKLPPKFAYGSRGAGCRGDTCVIPPDSTLLFDVEFLGKA